MGLKFPRKVVLNRRWQFEQARRKGRTFTGRFLRLNVLPVETRSDLKIGIIVTRKFGPATERNRVRRRLRELFRLHWPRIRSGHWLVAVVRPDARTADFSGLQAEWLRLMKRAAMINGCE